MSPGTRVLIVEGGSQRGVLAAARALGRAGNVVEVASEERAYASRSRWTSRWHQLPDSASAQLETVADVVRRRDIDVVFAGDDERLLLLSEHRDLLLPACFPYVAHDDVLSVVDKLLLYAAAARAGVAVPETRTERPKDGSDWLAKERLYSLGIAHEHRPADSATPGDGQLLFQRVVEGVLHAVVVFVDLDGSVSILSVQRAEALQPEPFGVSARAVSVDPARVVDATHALFAQLRWQGLVELQFIVSAEGVAHLIDANGRFFGSLGLTEAHVPACAAWLATALGERGGPLGHVPIGARYHWLEGDLRRALDSDHRIRELMRAVAWAPGAAHSLFAVRDLGPVAGLMGDIAGRLVTRRR